ncbi:hypothetical protein BGX33_012219 [Mortierella sp. NVP41]|nr:hypothetical protein BGX33_012219 [Mortierella sp. NVP41]
MGGLKLDCIAAHPNNKVVYGIGNAVELKSGTAAEFSLDTSTTVLVQSEPNPTSFSDLRWSIVATAPTRSLPLYWNQDFGTVDCAVSKTGVFSAFYVQKQQQQSTASNSNNATGSSWGGFRVNPELGTRGEGHWWPIGVPSTYDVPSSLASMNLWTHESYFVDQPDKTAGGGGQMRENLVHAMTSPREARIQFGVFGLQEFTANWTNMRLPPMLTRFGQKQFHIYSSYENTVTSYPLTSLTATIPNGVVSKTKVGILLDYILTGTGSNTTSFVACIGTTPHSQYPTQHLYFINDFASGNSTTSPTYNISGLTIPKNLAPFQFLSSILPNDNIESLFAVALTPDRGVTGISLSGFPERIGKAMDSGPAHVQGSYTSYPSNKGPKIVNGEDRDGEGGVTVGPMFAIIGVITVGLLVVFFGFKYWRARRSQLSQENRSDQNPIRFLSRPSTGPSSRNPPNSNPGDWLWVQDAGAVDCTVSKSGVFSVVYTKQNQLPGNGNGNATAEWDRLMVDLEADGSEQWTRFRAAEGVDWPKELKDIQSQESYFVEQPDERPGAAAGAMRESLVHAVSSRSEDLVRFGVYGLPEMAEVRPPVFWAQPSLPTLTRFGNGQFHTYNATEGTVTAYPAADMVAVPAKGVVVKTKDGIRLNHIFAGTQSNNSAPFLACIGTFSDKKQQMYFINDYLSNTNTTPSQTYTLSGPPFPTNNNTTTISFHFLRFTPATGFEYTYGIALSLTKELYSIHLGGISTEPPDISQTVNLGNAFVSDLYTSFQHEIVPSDGSNSGSKGKAASLSGGAIAGIVIGILASLGVLLLIFWLLESAETRKEKAEEAKERGSSSGIAATKV